MTLPEREEMEKIFAKIMQHINNKKILPQWAGL